MIFDIGKSPAQNPACQSSSRKPLIVSAKGLWPGVRQRCLHLDILYFQLTARMDEVGIQIVPEFDLFGRGIEAA